MINSIFGNKIDIHGGGIDLKFPHHENEIAQSMALNNNHLANYWMHNGHINVDGEKMSKSLGNFILAKDFIKMHDANVIKIALFKTHYRLPLNFTDELFNESTNINNKIYNALKSAKLYLVLNNEDISINGIRDNKFEEYMDDDFNTPNVITYLLELLKELNVAIRTKGENISLLYKKIMVITDILGLVYELPEITKSDIENYNKWQEYRNKKDFENADIYRNKLIEKNII